MAKPPPYPPKSSAGAKIMGPSKKKLKHPSFAGSDTEPYNVRPQKPKRPKPMPKSSDIDERITKPYKKRVTSGSTSARIRNMEKKYRRKLMEK